MKKAELLRTEHQVQLKWLDNQIANIANDGAKAFANAGVAERAYDRMIKESLITKESDLEYFISVYLSEIGLKKLITTLRVYRKRNSSERLQVEITRSNKALLNKIVNLTGKTKIEIINHLIANADLNEFQKLDQ